jgi:hypothetical protein
MPSSLTEIRSLARSPYAGRGEGFGRFVALELQHPAKVDIKLERSI